MFENTQRVVNDLIEAVSQDAKNLVNLGQATAKPAIAELLGKLSEAANKIKESVEDGSIFKPADVNEDAKSSDGSTFADPLPTADQNEAIKALRKVGKTDEEIAAIVGVSILTVKMAV